MADRLMRLIDRVPQITFADGALLQIKDCRNVGSSCGPDSEWRDRYSGSHGDGRERYGKGRMEFGGKAWAIRVCGSDCAALATVQEVILRVTYEASSLGRSCTRLTPLIEERALIRFPYRSVRPCQMISGANSRSARSLPM